MYPTPTATKLGSALSRLVAILEAMIRRRVQNMANNRRRRATIRTLRGLDDHLLTDVGLDRSQIVSAVDRIGRQQLPGDPTAAHIVHETQLKPELAAQRQSRDRGHANSYRKGFAHVPGVCVSPVEETPA